MTAESSARLPSTSFRCIHVGQYKPGHPHADGQGFHPKVLTLVRELGVSVVRHPGSIDDLDWLHQAKQRLAQLGIAHSTIQLEPPPQEKRQQS